MSTQKLFQTSFTLVLMLLYVLATNCSHPQEATSVEDKYSIVIRVLKYKW
jgi:hypothetical protein